jgi:hypothetical protein
MRYMVIHGYWLDIVPSIFSSDPHDVKCLTKIIPDNVVIYVFSLIHDDDSFWTWVMEHGDHWHIL